MSIPVAINRADVAAFVDALFLVYIILIFASIAISWVVTFRGSLPYNAAVRGVAGFVAETTGPYLNLFRRFIPPIGAGGMGIDLSPMIALIVLFVVRAVVVGLIAG